MFLDVIRTLPALHTPETIWWYRLVVPDGKTESLHQPTTVNSVKSVLFLFQTMSKNV